jgi:hypothetical protein
MDGRGDGTKLTEVELKQLEAAAKQVRFAYNHEPVRPLGITIPSANTRKKFNLEMTFGPELFFGLKVAEENPEQPMLFIKRSIGGTSLYGCWNPDWTAEKAAQMGESKQPKLYSDFIGYVQEMLRDLPPDSYEICGMFWVQGEADSGDKKGPEPEAQYEANLKNLIASVRRDLAVPELPFFIYQVGGGAVVEGMKSISKTVPNAYLVEQAWDEESRFYLPKYGPPTGHYDYEGMKRIGLNFADSFLGKTSLPKF